MSLLQVNSVSKHFPLGGGLLTKPRSWIRAVNSVSFDLSRGEILGLVGESGCGKSTLGRILLGLIKPDSGSVLFQGRDLYSLSKKELTLLRRKMQLIFQDPYSSLDPRMRVESIITEPLRVDPELSADNRRKLAAELLKKVGLNSEDLKKYPHEFSGGQRQRIGIARSLSVRPELIVADEPVSALDVSIQAQIINLLQDIKDEFDLSFIFIAHDLSVVDHFCDRIAVMYLGQIVESAPAAVFAVNPGHPYTEALLSAVPLPEPGLGIQPELMEGEVPDPSCPPPGCPFHPRCGHQVDRCRQQSPELTEIDENHFVACWQRC
ncbi:MAG: ABC transporter ATP-binding protein [Thermodesulfobacteriota bacterium]